MDLDKRLTPAEVEDLFNGCEMVSFKGTYDDRDGRGQMPDQEGSWSQEITIEFSSSDSIIIRSSGGMDGDSEMWIERA